jgi:hypothetical protein
MASASEAEDYEYYAYSSDEDGYPLAGGDDGDSNNSDMEWNASENPNAPPTTFARGMYIVMSRRPDFLFQPGACRECQSKPETYVAFVPEST